jgi:predicted AAA+ superfamily ATPase
MVNRLLSLSKLLKQNRSAFLFGPRGVGKTFLCSTFLQSNSYFYQVDLLKHELFTRYLTNPEIFRKEIESKINTDKILTVFVDEVQKLPSVLDEVHYLIEKYKSNVRFILTGSSARKLKRGGANLLAGRAWTMKLHPLTHLEIDIDISKALRIGTLPAIYLEDDMPERTLKSYVETYLKEEIMQEAFVRKIEGFIRFLEVAGQMNGKPLNFTKLARDCGVSTKTAQQYFSILQDTMIAFPVNAWTHSVRKQIMHAPKFYFFDCGVLNAICGEVSLEVKERSYRYGRLFETFLIQELIRINDYLEADYKFYYWKTNTGLEVDIILGKGINESPIAIEIKLDSAPQEKDFHALKSFKSENKDAILYCFCNTPNLYQMGDVTVFPWKEGFKKIFSIR